MRIVELTAYHVRIPLRRTVRHASFTRSSTDNLLVRCVLEDRTEGFGEGVPREYVTGETIDSAIALLRQSDLAGQCGSCGDFTQAVTLAERLRTAPIPGDDRDCGGNSARCGVELALLDAYGRHFGASLSTVTRLLAPDLYQVKPYVRYSGAITSGRGFKLRWAALRLWLYRFKQVKVKVGIANQNDVQRLSSIRRRVGWGIDLRVDANEAWAASDAITRIRELEPFRISAVEQPVPHAELSTLAAVRRQIQTPLMLDESLCSLVDAERAVALNACDLFNIRLSKCGGFIPALRLVQFARRHNLGYQLGCHPGETALLSAAGRHFATSVGGIRYLEGSYDRHLVREPLGTKNLTFRWGGWAPALSESGLGVTIDPRALERVLVRKETLLG